MNILQNLLLHETDDGEQRARAAYIEESEHLDKSMKELVEVLKKHEAYAKQNPYGKSVGQVIKVQHLLNDAIKALTAI